MCNFLLLTLPFIFLKYIECEQFLRNKELLATLSCLSGTECVAFIFLRNVHPHEVFFMFQERYEKNLSTYQMIPFHLMVIYYLTIMNMQCCFC